MHYRTPKIQIVKIEDLLARLGPAHASTYLPGFPGGGHPSHDHGSDDEGYDHVG